MLKGGEMVRFQATFWNLFLLPCKIDFDPIDPLLFSYIKLEAKNNARTKVDAIKIVRLVQLPPSSKVGECPSLTRFL